MKRYYVMEDGSKKEITQDYFVTFSDRKIKEMIEYLKGSIYRLSFPKQELLDADTYRKAFSRFLEKIGMGDTAKVKRLKEFYQLKNGEKSSFTFRCFDESYFDVFRIWFSGQPECDEEDRWVAMYNVLLDIEEITKDIVGDGERLAWADRIEFVLVRLMHGLEVIEGQNDEIVYKPLTEEKRERNVEYLKQCWKKYVDSLEINIKDWDMMRDLVQKIKDLKTDQPKKKDLEKAILHDYFKWKNKWMNIIAYMREDEALHVEAAIGIYNSIRDWIVITPTIVDFDTITRCAPRFPITNIKQKELLQKALDRYLKKYSTDTVGGV